VESDGDDDDDDDGAVAIKEEFISRRTSFNFLGRQHLTILECK